MCYQNVVGSVSLKWVDRIDPDPICKSWYFLEEMVIGEGYFFDLHHILKGGFDYAL